MPMQCPSVHPKDPTLRCSQIHGGHTRHRQFRDGELVEWTDRSTRGVPTHPVVR